VRIAFLDESGRSRQEPIIVVGGVVVHGDRTYRRLEEHLRQIVETFIPPADWDDFVFHTKDLFHGNGYFDKKVWPREKRLSILTELAAIPRKFELPVVFGHLDKSEYAADAKAQIDTHSRDDRDRAHVIDVAEHMVAFGRAEIAIERLMHIRSRATKSAW
jgi:hypothetical protein